MSVEQSQENPDKPPERRTAVIRLLAVVILALVIRGFLVAQPACISKDGITFVAFARQLGEDPVKWMRIQTKQPGFSFLLLWTHSAIGSWVGGDTPEGWQRCGELLAMLGGAAVCGLVYWITLKLFDQFMAIIAGVLACFWPHGAHLSADVLSDMPHLALYLAAFLLALRLFEKPRFATAAVCGVLAGMAYMLRQEALGIVAAIGICLLFMKAIAPLLKRVLIAAVFGAAFVAVVAPYSIKVGKLMPNKSLKDLVEDSPQADATQPAFTASLAAVPTWLVPGRAAEEWARSGRYVFSSLFLLAICLKRTPRAELRGRRLALAAVLVQLILIQLRVSRFGDISSRYLVIPVALCLPWAAAGFREVLINIWVRISNPTTSRRASVGASVAIICLAPLVYYLTLPVNHGKQPYREAGQWLMQNAEKQHVIMANTGAGQIVYYADRTWPDDRWLRCEKQTAVAQIVDRIRRKRPDWFIDATGTHGGELDEAAHFKTIREEGIRHTTQAKHFPPPASIPNPDIAPQVWVFRAAP